MAITRAQQARQMLKKAGFVVQDGFKNYIKNSESVTVPKEFKSREDATPTKLAYITKDEAKMLKKMKKGTPHKGPKGIPSYDDYDAATGSFRSGAAMSAAETGGKTERDRADMRAAGIGPQEARDLRSAAIAAGAGQRVNPGFFDSRNLVSPADLAAARAIAPKAFARSRGSGIMNFIRGGGLFGNLIRGLGQRFGFGRKFNEPSFDMSRFANLPLGGSASFQNLDIRDKFDRRGTDDDEDDTLNIDEFGYSPNFLSGLVDEVALTGTPEQKKLIKEKIEDPKEQDFTNFENAMFASAKPLDYRIGLSNKTTKSILDGGFNLDGTEMTPEEKMEYERQKKEMEKTSGLTTQFAADGGVIGGGIMDATGRQNYFLGKLVKKATRAVKKIVKSPIGKLGLGAALAFTPFGKAAIGKFAGLSTPMKALIGGGVLSSLPLLFQQEEEQGEGLGTTGSVGGQIDPRAYTDPYGVLFPAFRAEGSPKEGEKGIMKMAGYLDPMSEKNDMAMEMFGKQLKDLTEDELDILNEEIQRLRSKFMAEGGSTEKEPVAKKTMPLLDMGGKEMDLRAEGGFVPIGRMEKADDVPARLSKNEFVFTADAVRNAGDGDVDKGAEVMYNMMKNLEAGGDVSEESQGLEGARNMFQTSKRLEEVI